VGTVRGDATGAMVNSPVIELVLCGNAPVEGRESVLIQSVCVFGVPSIFLLPTGDRIEHMQDKTRRMKFGDRVETSPSRARKERLEPILNGRGWIGKGPGLRIRDWRVRVHGPLAAPGG